MSTVKVVALEAGANRRVAAIKRHANPPLSMQPRRIVGCMLRGGLAGLVIAATLLVAPAAKATTFTVDTKKDLLDDDPGGRSVRCRERQVLRAGGNDGRE